MKKTLDDIYSNQEEKNENWEVNKQGNNSFGEVIVDLSTNYMDLLKEIEKACEVGGKIDQKFLYIDPIAVKKWKSLIDSDEYATYRECSDALREFLASNIWKEKVQSGLNTIVDLGVGAGQKDNSILKSFINLTNGNNPISFVLIDTSFPMIETTLDQLRPVLKKKNNVKVISLKTDFLTLKHSSSHYQKKDSKSAYFMLGCTFCNVKESLFMNSMSEVVRNGDLLVLGIELYDEQCKDDSLQKIKNSYNHEALRELALIPLRMVLDRQESDDELKDKIDIDISEDRSHSDVPKAATIVITAFIQNEADIVLASSSRYGKTYLKEYIESYGYTFHSSFASSSNRLYEHLVFKFTGEGK